MRKFIHSYIEWAVNTPWASLWSCSLAVFTAHAFDKYYHSLTFLSFFSVVYVHCQQRQYAFLTSDASNANFYGSSLWFLTNMYEGKSRSKGTFEKWYTYSNDRKLKHTLFFLHYLPALQRTLCNVSQVSWFRRKKKIFFGCTCNQFCTASCLLRQ